MDITTLLLQFNDALALWLVIPAILIGGIILTFRLRALQITSLGVGVRHLLEKNDKAKGSISNFEAISAVLAGNLGTGNISGMAVAIAMGGPGALVWMWMMVFFGMIIKYAGCLLGVKYRHVNTEGEYVGGPMYYLKEGMGMPILAGTFALCCIATSFTVGNLVQVNSLILPLQNIGVPPLAMGVFLAIAIGLVLMGGLQRIAHVVTAVVPAMTLLYLGTALVILFFHIDRVPAAFSLMFSSAFSTTAAAGGATGYGMMRALTAGFERGVFATDAGLGIAPVLQASARTRNAATEGAVAMLAPVIVVVVCTITSLVLIVTDAWQQPGLQSTTMCTWAFKEGLGHYAAEAIVVLALLLFGFTTVLAWAFCAEKATEYLFGLKAIRWFNFFFILCVPIGALAKVELVWALADLSVGLMLLCNMVGVIGLTKEVVKESGL